MTFLTYIAGLDLPKSPTLRFDEKGNFTILQVADLHFSVGPGSCRDVDTTREEECRRKGADRYSLEWLESALDEVKPDLVVLTGDQYVPCASSRDTCFNSSTRIESTGKRRLGRLNRRS